MTKPLINQFLSLRKTVLLGVIFLFLILVVGCEFFHNESNCNIHFILTSQLSSKENLLFYSILLLSLIAVNLLTSLKRNQKLSFLNFSLLSLLIFLWFQEFVFKIFNPILSALSQGIIHPKIYKLNTISS